jgi:hypothetical protein
MDEGGDFVRVFYTEPYTFDEWLSVVEELRRNPLFAFQRRIGSLIDRTHVGPPPTEFTEAVAAYISTSAAAQGTAAGLRGARYRIGGRRLAARPDVRGSGRHLDGIQRAGRRGGVARGSLH